MSEIRGAFGFRIKGDIKDLAGLVIPANITYREANGELLFKARYTSPEEKGRMEYEMHKIADVFREKLGLPALQEVKLNGIK